MIIVLGGTTEGREVIAQLTRLNYPITATVVSSYGAELLENNELCDTRQGALTKSRLVQLIKDTDSRFLIDATHPFAVEISQIAMESTTEQDIYYIRLERKRIVLPQHDLITIINAIEQIEPYIFPGQTVFNTMGSKNLDLIVPLIKKYGATLVTRVLPSAGVIKKCENLGLNSDHIIAAKGPFSAEFNKQMFKHYDAQLILTKDSGTAGGLETKLQAALELNIPVLVWSRPRLSYPRLVYSAQEAVESINALLQTSQGEGGRWQHGNYMESAHH